MLAKTVALARAQKQEGEVEREVVMASRAEGGTPRSSEVRPAVRVPVGLSVVSLPLHHITWERE